MIGSVIEQFASDFPEALDIVMDGAPRIGTLSMLIGIELRHEPTGLSCDQLARRLRRRRADVLLVLEDEPRFQPTGMTKGARWTRRDGIGGPASSWRDSLPIQAGEGKRAA